MNKHSHAILTTIGKRETGFFAFPEKEAVWNLEQHPGAIPGFLVCADRPSVGQIRKDSDPLFDYCVRACPADIDHESHATGLVFETRIV